MKKQVIKMVFIVSIILLSACTSTKVKQTMSNSDKIKTNERYYIAMTKNNEVEVSTKIFEFLKNKKVDVVLGKKIESEEEALRSAETINYNYVIYPTINHWIDVFYGWCKVILNDSSKSYVDKADVNIAIYNVKNKEKIGEYNLLSSGCPISPMAIPIGTTTPGGHFKKSLNRWWSNYSYKK